MASAHSETKFSIATGVTMAAQVFNLVVGTLVSIIVARILGPAGRGVYALVLLLYLLIVAFINLGIGPATIYYVAREEFSRQEIVGNNILLSLGIGVFGIAIGLVIIFFWGEVLFPNIAVHYLIGVLFFIPLNLFFSYLVYVLLGSQRIVTYNYVLMARPLFLFIFTVLLLWGAKAGIAGALIAELFTWVILDVLVFQIVRTMVGGVAFRPNFRYIKKAVGYGIRAHLSNVLAFLNYRLDTFLVNSYLDATQVGLYAVAAGLAERVWMISRSASTVLFPKIAATVQEEQRKNLTPLVARTVLWASIFAVVVLGVSAHWIILLLYSDAFLPATRALQSLLLGIVTLSVSRVLANDIAGRGAPQLNLYRGIVTVVTNVTLNIVWIPRYGIVGAAWASSVSYTVSFLSAFFVYCRLSDARCGDLIFLKRSDWILYWKTGQTLWQWARNKVL